MNHKKHEIITVINYSFDFFTKNNCYFDVFFLFFHCKNPSSLPLINQTCFLVSFLLKEKEKEKWKRKRNFVFLVI